MKRISMSYNERLSQKEQMKLFKLGFILKTGMSILNKYPP